MLALLRRRPFALLWAAGFVSLLGDWLLLIALPFFVYDLTGSALASGATFMASTLPRVLLGSVAGVFVDRWDRRRTLIASDLLRGGLLLGLLLVHSADTVWLVYAVAMAQATLAQFFVPAQRALLPRLVAGDELLAANGLLSLSENLTRLIGPVVGGVLYGALGLPSIVALDAGSFFLSGALLAGIAAGAAGAAPARDGAATPARLRDEWLGGLRVVAGDRLLTRLFVIAGIAMIGEGFFVSLLVPFARDVLGGDATRLGWLMSAQALGGIAGGLVLGRVAAAIRPLRLIALGGLLDGALLLAIINGRSLPLALVLIALAGVPVVAFFVGVQTLVQATATDRFRGRVFGAFGTVAALMTMVGMGLASALVDHLGTAPTMSLGAATNIVAGLVALATALAPAVAGPPASEPSVTTAARADA